jgi:MFS transporter, ACS family, hexuronate transporter
MLTIISRNGRVSHAEVAGDPCGDLGERLKQAETSVVEPSPEEHLGPSVPMTGYRWRICALLFIATTLNYMDRQVLALLKPTLEDPGTGIGLTEVQFAAIVSVFSAAYAIGLLVAGRFVDRVGTRIGYAVAVSFWTIASASHYFVGVHAVTGALQSSMALLVRLLAHLPGISSAHWVVVLENLSGAVICLAIVRFALGLGEAGNFPSAVKAVAEWFPRKERALATGIFNSGTNIGATIAPFTVAFVLYHLGWRYAFLTTSILAAMWLILWLTMYRRPGDVPFVSPSELTYINQDERPQVEEKIAWVRLVRYRQTWAFLIGKVITDPIWWFYLYWLPGFLHTRFGLSLMAMGMPLLVVYNSCTLGSILGGWLPVRLISLGWTVNRARKSAMLLYAVLMLPILLIGRAKSVWEATALISLATSAHQAWSANLFTLVSDMFPRPAVASVVGIGACGGSVSMMFFGLLVGFVLTLTHGNYMPVFLMAGTAYLFAIATIHLIVPRLQTVSFE